MSRFVLSYAGPFLVLLLVVLGLTGNLFSSDPFVIAGSFWDWLWSYPKGHILRGADTP